MAIEELKRWKMGFWCLGVGSEWLHWGRHPGQVLWIWVGVAGCSQIFSKLKREVLGYL